MLIFDCKDPPKVDSCVNIDKMVIVFIVFKNEGMKLGPILNCPLKNTCTILTENWVTTKLSFGIQTFLEKTLELPSECYEF